MGWEMPWYSVPEEWAELLLAGRHFGMKVCYLRDGDHVFETYWTTARGCEAMSGSYGMLDMTVYGRQEQWEDSPEGWPQPFATDGAQFREVRDEARQGRLPGRPTPQWSRLAAGRSDDLGAPPRDRQQPPRPSRLEVGRWTGRPLGLAGPGMSMRGCLRSGRRLRTVQRGRRVSLPPV